MTWGIINKVNEIVRPNDIIFNLGDFCLNTTEEEFESFLSALNCQNIYYITGNHNSRIKDAYKKALQSELGRADINAYPVRYKNIVFCGDYMEVVIDGQLIIMCHYPMDVFNEMRHSAIMVCGHSHYTYEKTRSDYQGSKRLDLSWDGHMKPLSFQEVRNIMNKKNIPELDHHTKNLVDIPV
jgi:calcineurin-like phosphoesterase family protein